MNKPSDPLPFALSIRLVGLFVSSLLVAAVACGVDRDASNPSVVDDLGTEVTLSAPAERVVSLSPPITELLFAVGAGDRLVGRTQWDVYPPEAERVPSVGEGLPPNVEVVVATRPDLVLFYASPSNASAIDQLHSVGIPTFSTRIDSLASVAVVARQIGALVGKSHEAALLATRFESQLDSARQATESHDTRIVLLVWDNPPIVLGAGSFLSELVTLAGGRNVFDDVEEASITVTIETIAERNPDVAVIAAGDDTKYTTRPEWRAVRALAARQTLLVSGSEFSWPSPRAFDAVVKLEQALNAMHPLRER